MLLIIGTVLLLSTRGSPSGALVGQLDGGGPSVDLKITGNGQGPSDGTLTGQAGQVFTLTWTSSGVIGCDTGTSQTPAPWSGNLATSGSVDFTITRSVTFGIQCVVSINNIVQDSVAVSVVALGACCSDIGQQCVGDKTISECEELVGATGFFDQSNDVPACSDICLGDQPQTSSSASSAPGCGGNPNAFCSVNPGPGGGCIATQPSVCGAGQTTQGVPGTTCISAGCAGLCQVCVPAPASSAASSPLASSSAGSASSSSSSSAFVMPACGNGWLDTGETCDDRNLANGDCCSGSCQVEGGACMCQNPPAPPPPASSSSVAGGPLPLSVDCSCGEDAYVCVLTARNATPSALTRQIGMIVQTPAVVFPTNFSNNQNFNGMNGGAMNANGGAAGYWWARWQVTVEPDETPSPTETVTFITTPAFGPGTVSIGIMNTTVGGPPSLQDASTVQLPSCPQS